MEHNPIRANLTWLGLLAIVLALSACGPRWTPPTLQPPTPEFVRTDATEQTTWDAAVDLLIDTGMEWDFLDNDLRAARIRTIVVPGNFTEGGVRIRNPAADAYADCGRRGDEPGAGWGELWASIAIRVRRSEDGRGLLKVVVPAMWQVLENYGLTGGGGPLPCVTKGAYEAELLSIIESRLTPRVRSRP